MDGPAELHHTTLKGLPRAACGAVQRFHAARHDFFLPEFAKYDRPGTRVRPDATPARTRTSRYDITRPARICHMDITIKLVVRVLRRAQFQ